MIKKGIILAGGTGSRMSPLTKAVNKQLLPIYDKPLIFYPLSVLMLAKIKNILIIVNKGQLEQYKKILPDGKNLGIKINYAEQAKPKGLPDAFVVGEKFIGKDNVSLILGDNFFYGQSFSKKLIECSKLKNGAKVLLYKVSNPQSYGVAKLNKYKSNGKLKADFIGRGGAWLDTGTIDDFYKTSSFVSSIENRQGLKIACLEEIALNNKWISKKNINDSIKFYGKCLYSEYLKKLK